MVSTPCLPRQKNAIFFLPKAAISNSQYIKFFNEKLKTTTTATITKEKKTNTANTTKKAI